MAVAEDWLRKVFTGTRGCDLCGGTGVDPIKHRVTGENVVCRACGGGKVLEQVVMVKELEGGEQESIKAGVELGKHGEALTYCIPISVLANKYRAIIEDDVTYPTDDAKKKACYEQMEPIEKELFGKLGWGG